MAQASTVQRFQDLQSSNAALISKLAQLKLQLHVIAQEKEAAVAHKQKRAADRIKRRPEHNKALQVSSNNHWQQVSVGGKGICSKCMLACCLESKAKSAVHLIPISAAGPNYRSEHNSMLGDRSILACSHCSNIGQLQTLKAGLISIH